MKKPQQKALILTIICLRFFFLHVLFFVNPNLLYIFAAVQESVLCLI